MAAPAWLGPAISAGANLLGGLMGKSSAERSNYDQARFNAGVLHQAELDRETQRQFAQHGIAWRVADAKEAGVHPLFALGAQVSSYSPVATGGAAPVDSGAGGRAMARGVADAGASVAQWLTLQSQLGLQAAQEKKDLAIAQYYESEAARNRQGRNTGPAFPATVQGTPNQSGPFDGYFDVRKVEANPTFSRDSNDSAVGAGSSPFWRAYEIAPGKMLDLPHTEEGPSEAMENLTLATWPVVIAQNMRHYGPDWLKEMASLIQPFLEKLTPNVNFTDRSWNRPPSE